MTMNIFVLRKSRLIIELCHYFIFVLSTSGTVAVKTGENQLLVGYKFGSVLVLYNTIDARRTT